MRNSAWLAVRMAAACTLALAASACTFVKPDAQSAEIRLAQASDVAACKKIGHTTVTVPYKLGFIPRSSDSVATDLLTMGRNSAVDMHGDTIVATSPPKEGNQGFDVYRCRK